MCARARKLSVREWNMPPVLTVVLNGFDIPLASCTILHVTLARYFVVCAGFQKRLGANQLDFFCFPGSSVSSGADIVLVFLVDVSSLSPRQAR